MRRSGVSAASVQAALRRGCPAPGNTYVNEMRSGAKLGCVGGPRPPRRAGVKPDSRPPEYALP